MRRFMFYLWQTMCLSGLGILWIFFLIIATPGKSHGFIAAEMSRGVVELSPASDEGMIITESVEKHVKASNEDFIYFCVTQTNTREKRCFYGQKEEFYYIHDQLKLDGLQYSIMKYRFKNDKGYIPIGRGRYFYHIELLRPSA